MAKRTKKFNRAQSAGVVALPEKPVRLAMVEESRIPREGKPLIGSEIIEFLPQYKKALTRDLKPSKILDFFWLSWNVCLVETAEAFYIVLYVHSYSKEPPLGLIYLGFSDRKPMPGYGLKFHKMEFSKRALAVGVHSSMTSPVTTVEKLWTEEGYSLYSFKTENPDEGTCVVLTPCH